MKQIFAKKPLKVLLDEVVSENRLRRVLGPVALTSLGVGAIIGTGIFVLSGVAAHDKSGPAIILSFVVSGFACVFAALCYAEFASMVPVAGSAYTYAYATLGELFAWIIGWDLILEYAVASATVAHGWSHYFQDFISILGFKFGHAISNAPFDFNPATGLLHSTGSVLDLPAIIITIVITFILVKGIKESAGFNAGIVILKLGIVFLVLIVGAFYINPANWHPFAPFGLSGLSFFGRTVLGQAGPGGAPVGVLGRRCNYIFCLYRFRFCFDTFRRSKKPQKRCSNRNYNFTSTLHGSLYCRIRSVNRDGAV